MSLVTIDDSHLTNIANAIREKTGETATYTTAQMPVIISSIETGSTPEGTIEITTNGAHDVSDYAYANVQVGETTVTKGFIVNAWNSSGYPTDISIVGLTTVPNYYIGSYNTANPNPLAKATKIVRMPDVTNAGYNSFYNNSTLKTIIAPALKTIGNYAFRYCKNLELTELPSGVTSIGEAAFHGCGNIALTELPSGVTRIEPYTFQYCDNLALNELPSGVTYIGAYAFCGCPKITLTELPSGITSIGNYTFKECSNLALTELPSGVTSIGENAFDRCTSLTEMTIPSGVTSISSNSFSYCTSLTEITFQGSITSIDSTAFYNSRQLTKISLPNVTTVPKLSNTNSFKDTPIASGTGYIYVPDDLVESFKTATKWSTYADQIKPISELTE